MKIAALRKSRAGSTLIRAATHAHRYQINMHAIHWTRPSNN